MTGARVAAASFALAATVALAGCRAAPLADGASSDTPPSAAGGAIGGDGPSMPVSPSGPVGIDPIPSPLTTLPARLPATPGRPPAIPYRLTDGGCCVRPFWRADSRALRFIDRLPGAGEGDGREVARLPRGSLAGWLGDDALLVRARADDGPSADIDVLWRQPLAGDAPVEILRAPRMRGLALSPDRRHLAYSVSGADGADANGLWLAAVDGATPPHRLDDLFGAYRWRDGARLIVVPFDIGAPSMRLVEVDAVTRAVRPLTDPTARPFRIAGGDWSVSPDGRRVAFVSAADRNVWVIPLADGTSG